jgi:hypothetical protein
VTTGVGSGTDWIELCSSNVRLKKSLPAEIKAMQEKADADLKEMMARLEAKTEFNQKKMDDGQEEMKAQLASLASWIDANRKEMNAKIDTTTEKMDAWIAEMKGGQKKETMAC